MGKFRTILLMILLLSFLLLSITFLLSTPQQSPFWVTLEGKVVPTDKTIQDYLENPDHVLSIRPQYVDVRQNLISNRYTIPHATGQSFGRSLINWENDTYGNYSVSLELPIQMSLILTGGEIINSVKIDRSSQVVNYGVEWQRIESTSDSPVPILSEQRKRADQQIRHVDQLKSSYGMGEDYVGETNFTKDMKEAKEQFEGELQASTEEDKLRKVLYAEWFAQRAWGKLEIFRLVQCIERVDSLGEQYLPIFYVPTFGENETVRKAKNYLKGDVDLLLLAHESVDPYKDNKSIISEIRSLKERRAFVEEHLGACELTYNSLNENYKYQKSFLQTRILALFSLIVITFLLGFISENKLKFFQKGKVKLNLFNESLVQVWRWIEQRTIPESKIGKIFIPAAFGILALETYLGFVSPDNPLRTNARVALVITLISVSLIIVSTLLHGKYEKLLRNISVMLLITSIAAILLFAIFLKLLLGTTGVIVFITYKLLNLFFSGFQGGL